MDTAPVTSNIRLPDYRTKISVIFRPLICSFNLQRFGLHIFFKQVIWVSLPGCLIASNDEQIKTPGP